MKIPAAFCGGRFGPNGIGKIPKALGMYMDPNLSKSGKAETSSDFPLFASNFAFESFLEMYDKPQEGFEPSTYRLRGGRSLQVEQRFHLISAF